jgi:dimethylamine/trimethylamine dehydrogenase
MSAVHLLEGSERLGGHVSWVSELPGMHEWRRVIDWRLIQLDKLDSVSVVLRSTLGATAVLDYGADLVVVATGSTWASDGMNGFTHEAIPGAALENVLTPEDVFRDQQLLYGERVVVYDTEGYFMGVSVAEKLQRDGYQVTLVTPMMEPAPYMRFTGEIVHMRPLLERLGVEIVTEHLVTKITPAAVEGSFVYVPERLTAWPADSVVLVTQRNPNDLLYQELLADPSRLDQAGISGLYRVGDCHSPRQLVADAIFDGHRLAREIDTADPATPLPYIRERRLLGAKDSDYEAVIDRSAV